MPVSPSAFFPRLPYLPFYPRHFFAFFSIGCSGKTGGERREKITRRQQTCFHMIVEQGHKLLKGPIVRSNR
ncbi:MAG: hypothetical protein ACK56F_31780, partial [bacterium]